MLCTPQESSRKLSIFSEFLLVINKLDIHDECKRCLNHCWKDAEVLAGHIRIPPAESKKASSLGGFKKSIQG